MSERSIYTLAVHAGEDRSAHFGAVSVPVYNASVYAFTDAEEGAAIHNEFKHGYYYGRLDVLANTHAGRAAAVEPYAGWFGERWFVLPNPTYGSWEPALFNNDWTLPRARRDAAKRGALRTD